MSISRGNSILPLINVIFLMKMKGNSLCTWKRTSTYWVMSTTEDAFKHYNKCWAICRWMALESASVNKKIYMKSWLVETHITTWGIIQKKVYKHWNYLAVVRMKKQINYNQYCARQTNVIIHHTSWVMFHCNFGNIATSVNLLIFHDRLFYSKPIVLAKLGRIYRNS